MVGVVPDINNRIDELWSDHRELVTYLQADNQLQLISRVEETFSKTLMIAAASYFEVQLTQAIVRLYIESTQGAEVLAQFVRKQAIGRRFAQLFQWGNETRSGRNANSFYSLFGADFGDYMKMKVQGDQNLDDSVKAFLEIGNLRNQMVHGNYADFQLNKTVDDVYGLYQVATKFVDEFPDAIREFVAIGQVQ